MNVPIDRQSATAPNAHHSANVPVDLHLATQVAAGLFVALAASLATVAPLLLRVWLATHDAHIAVPLL